MKADRCLLSDGTLGNRTAHSPARAFAVASDLAAMQFH